MLNSPLKKNFGIILWAFSSGLAVAWMVEAFAAGRGPISKYVAPFAIVGLLVSTIIRMRQGRNSGQ